MADRQGLPSLRSGQFSLGAPPGTGRTPPSETARVISNPPSLSFGRDCLPPRNAMTPSPRARMGSWRTGRDSNPGYPFGVRTFSKGVLSTTQPPIHGTCVGRRLNHMRRMSSMVPIEKMHEKRDLHGEAAGCRLGLYELVSSNSPRRAPNDGLLWVVWWG